MKRKASTPKIENIFNKKKRKSFKDSKSTKNNKTKSKPKNDIISSKNITINEDEDKFDDCSFSLNSDDSDVASSLIDEGYKFSIKEEITNIDLKKTTLMTNLNIGTKRIRLGLCCLNNFLRAQKETVFCSRSITLATYKSKGYKAAIDKATENVKDLIKLIEWNKDHHIECLRIASDLFPHYSNIYYLTAEERYSMDFAKKGLKMAGDLAKKYNHRITMHPGQFNVVGTENENALKKTIIDLEMHADILDAMGMDGNSIMVVHGGGTYGDKEKTILRWISNYKKLPAKVQNRLVLENCEKNFSIIDCLRVSEEINIPVVFDNHHFNCYKLLHPNEKFEDIRVYIKASIETWLKKGLRPKFHLSEQEKDRPIGTHSNFIKIVPDYYLEIPKEYGIGVDIMIEAKAKEAAILKIYKNYKKQLLSHLDEKDLPNDYFEIDKEKLQAKLCSRCDI